jgi:hypothetical protein
VDDTPPEIKALYHAMWMRLPPEERFIRGALMFDAARAMVLASLPKNLSPDELRRRLYERMYGEPLPADFPTKDKAEILLPETTRDAG